MYTRELEQRSVGGYASQNNGCRRRRQSVLAQLDGDAQTVEKRLMISNSLISIRQTEYDINFNRILDLSVYYIESALNKI